MWTLTSFVESPGTRPPCCCEQTLSHLHHGYHVDSLLRRNHVQEAYVQIRKENYPSGLGAWDSLEREEKAGSGKQEAKVQ